MNKLITILLLLIAGATFAQQKTPQTISALNIQGVAKDQFKVDSFLYLPLTDTIRNPGRAGVVIVKASDLNPYLYNGTKWVSFGSTADLALKLNISDTASMLGNYLRKIDTTGKWVTAILRRTGTDSVFYVKGGSQVFAYRDSTGGGGSTPTLQQVLTAGNRITTSPQLIKGTGPTVLQLDSFTNINWRHKGFFRIQQDGGQQSAVFNTTTITLTAADGVIISTPSAGFFVLPPSLFSRPVTVLDTTTITTMGNSDSSDRAASTAWVKRQAYGSGGGGSGITDLTGDITATGPGSAVATIANNAVTTVKINNNAVTNAKVATGVANSLAGYDGSGGFSGVTVGSGLSLSGGTLTTTGGGSSPILAPQKIGYGNASGLLSGTGSGAFTVDTANRKAFLDSVNTKNYQTNTIAKHADSSVYFGTSITAGTGAFNNNYRFATVTARSFNTLEANYGQGGASLQVDMLAKIPLIAPYNYLLHRFIVMEWLTNDIINGSNIGTWDTAHAGPIYRRVIDTCLARGWPASKIIIVSPGYIDSTAFTNATGARQLQYWSLSQDVATSRGVKFVDVKNPEAALGNSILMQDQNLHPNNDGHALYAQLIRQILTDSVRIEGQAMGVTGVAEFNRLKVRIVDTATAFGIPLSIEPDGTLARSWRDDYIRNSYRLTQPQGAALSLTGKGFFGNVTSPNAVDVIQANGAINGQILKATGTTPSGTTGAFAGMYFVPGSYGGLFAYDYTGGSALDFTVNPFGTRLAVGSATFSGAAILQVAGTSTGTDPADGDSSHTYISSGWFKRNASGPSGSFIPLSFSGVVNVTQNSHFLNFDYGVNSSFLRATGSDVSTTGAGVGMAYSGGVGFIYAYDRDASTGKDMSIGAFSDRTIFGSSSFYNAAKTQFAGAAYFNDNISIGVYPGTQALDVGQAARIRGILYTNDTAALDKRFSYNSNIHSSFTQYSLIDKAYADSAYGSSASDTLKLAFAGTGERTFWGSNDTLHGKTIKGLNSVSIASGTDSTINAKLVNDTAIGTAASYYYGTSTGGSAGRLGYYALPSAVNIYNTDGTLTANRSLAAGGHALSLGTSGDKLTQFNVNSSGPFVLIASNGGTLDPGAGGSLSIGNSGSANNIKGGIELATLLTATDANVSITNSAAVILPVITANRTFQITGFTGKFIIIMNRNSAAFTWSPTGTTIVDGAGNTISSLVNGKTYILYYDGTNYVSVLSN